MLGKLLKHEFRANRSTIIGLYVFVIVSLVIKQLFKAVRKSVGPGVLIGTAETIFGVMMLMAVIAMFAVILLVSITRYRDNLVKDEGYLMHTIPVKAWALHFVKLIVPLIWLAGATFLALISVEAITADELTLKQMLEPLFLPEYAHMSWGITGYIVLATINLLSAFYASINVGSLFSTNKGIMAIVAYIVTYVINQVLNVGAIFIAIFAIYADKTDVLTIMEADKLPDNVGIVIIAAAVIVCVLTTVAYNLISVYILKNKVNLE